MMVLPMNKLFMVQLKTDIKKEKGEDLKPSPLTMVLFTAYTAAFTPLLIDYTLSMLQVFIAHVTVSPIPITALSPLTSSTSYVS